LVLRIILIMDFLPRRWGWVTRDLRKRVQLIGHWTRYMTATRHGSTIFMGGGWPLLFVQGGPKNQTVFEVT